MAPPTYFGVCSVLQDKFQQYRQSDDGAATDSPKSAYCIRLLAAFPPVLHLARPLGPATLLPCRRRRQTRYQERTLGHSGRPGLAVAKQLHAHFQNKGSPPSVCAHKPTALPAADTHHSADRLAQTSKAASQPQSKHQDTSQPSWQRKGSCGRPGHTQHSRCRLALRPARCCTPVGPGCICSSQGCFRPEPWGCKHTCQQEPSTGQLHVS